MNVSPTTSHDMGTGRDTVVTHTRARLYDPVLMRFTTLDPLAEKYYPTSPYAYCQNDPLGYIDLDGKDNYRVTGQGYLQLIKKTNSSSDYIYSSINSDEKIEVPKSFIGGQLSETITATSSSGEKEMADVTTYTGQELMPVYLFMRDNTNVEWSFLSVSRGNTSTEHIGTSHSDGSDASQSYMNSKYCDKDAKVIIARHFHTNGSTVVSQGDVDVAKEIQKKSPQAKFYIDIPRSNESIEYDSQTEPYTLPGVIIEFNK